MTAESFFSRKPSHVSKGKSLLLNCDLAEHKPVESARIAGMVMPYIDQANLCCGAHAGSPAAMRAVLEMAKQHNVAVGAHPGYPDREHFGRRSLTISADDLTAQLHYQIAALEGMAASLGIAIHYVKPHGALYHDILHNAQVRATVLQAIVSYHQSLPLMLQATPVANELQAIAEQHGVELLFEAFADRQYTDEGNLLARDQPGAVLNAAAASKQAADIAQRATVMSASGKAIPLQADTLCVHGDHADSVASIQAIRATVGQTTDQAIDQVTELATTARPPL